MKNTILVIFLSLWIFSILAPAVIAVVDKDESSLVLFCHSEEEPQENGKKDTAEEKIVPDEFQKDIYSQFGEQVVPIDGQLLLSSLHEEEIHLPPPEPFI